MTTVWSFTFTSIPSFFLALLAVFVFAVRLDWFPTGGMHVVRQDRAIRSISLRHLILPDEVLGLLHVPGYVRYVRASMLDVMRQDFVRTARAKGLREGSVTWRHTLPNALAPLITHPGIEPARPWLAARC